MAVELGNGPRQIQLVKPGGVSQRAWDAACAKIRAEINAGAFSQAGDSPGKLQGEIQAAADKTAIEIQKKMEPGNGLSGSRVALGTAAAGEGTAAATGTSLMMDVMTDQLIDGTLFGAAEINQAFGRAFRTFHSIRMANFAVAAAAVIAPRGGLDSSLQGSVMKDIQGDAKLKREVQDRMGRNDVDGAMDRLWHRGQYTSRAFHEKLEREGYHHLTEEQENKMFREKGVEGYRQMSRLRHRHDFGRGNHRTLALEHSRRHDFGPRSAKPQTAHMTSKVKPGGMSPGLMGPSYLGFSS